MRRYILLFSFTVVLSLSAFSQNAFWSNTGLVSLKPGAYLSIIGDAYNQDSGIYNNNDSIFLTGNWSHTAPNRCFDSIGAGWVYLYAANQHITGTYSTHFFNLVLQNQGVKYGDLDVYVDGQLQLNDREFSMDTNTVWVLNPDTGAVTRTTGYVSSLVNGGLLRRTNSVLPYLFPVGSNVGTFRYRPVEFDPLNANVNHYKARFANVDPTTEGFNRSIKAPRVCELNPVWYHRLFHQYGNDSANITIMYDSADGNWNDIAHWQNVPEWESIQSNTNVPGSPFNRITKFTWNNYTYAPFDLAIVSKLTIADSISNVSCYGAQDGAITLTILNAEATYSFIWSNGDTTQSISGLSGGTYSVTLSEVDRCAFSDTFTVSEPTPLRASDNKTNATCYGAANGTISVQPEGGTGPYTIGWNIRDTAQNIVTNLDSGTYIFVVTDANGCSITDTVNITQPPRAPYAVAGVDTIIWKTDTIQLDGFLGANYSWAPNFNLSCTNCSNPYAWPDTNVTYYLTITDTIGCLTYDSVRIFVRDKPLPLFFIPNVITPNGDGFNDVWYIRDLEGYPDNSMRIVNRWGDEVFEQTPYQNNWAGTYKDEKLPGGTYYYILIIHNNGQDMKFDGPITIVR